MNPEDAEEYTQALGQVMGGGYRQVLLGQKLGVPRALGLTTEEWVTGRLGGYVRMAIPERRDAVKELAKEGLSQREIASVLGVTQPTVSSDLRDKFLSPMDEYRAEGSETDDKDLSAPHPPLSVVDTQTGEVIATAEEYHEQRRQEEQSAAALIAAVPDPDNKATVWKLRHMVAQGVSNFSSNVLVLDPVAASEACDEGQRRDMVHFRRQVDEWVAAFERASARGIRAVR
jgi:transcriptional regulator with XRE-family HTH domain